MKNKIIRLLNDIENRIDIDVETDYNNQWEDFLNNKFTGDIFTPERKRKSSSEIEKFNININDAINDYDLMMLSQLQGVSDALNSSRPLNLRSNYGTGILSSLFGLDVFIMPYETNTLPTTIPLNDTNKIHEIVSEKSIDINVSLGKKVFDMGEYYMDVFKNYPKIQKCVEIYHPDLQGPLDVCELVWGSEMFYQLYDAPELVHEMLNLICDVYTQFIIKWYEIVGQPKEINSHWTIKHKGALMIRDDSAMNLSPEMYKEFGYKYDDLLLNKFNGGAVHFCGRGEHYIDILCKAKKLTAINLSQPHLNDMEKIYQNTVDSGIKILEFNRNHALADIGRAGKFHHNLHTS